MLLFLYQHVHILLLLLISEGILPVVLSVEISFVPAYVIFCAIWYHLYNLENVKNTSFAKSLKVTLLHRHFLRFLIVQMVQNRAKHHIQ